MSQKIKDILKGFFPYFATPAMIVFLIWNYATDKANDKNLQFDSVEDKVNTKNHVKNAPSPEQLQRKLILDSINNMHAIKSRKIRDSILRHNDSINRLNADQVYQIKEELRSIKEKLN